ncbi:hypothetical protein FF011L_04850 [Roseimaritima multifibrata]|uniref:Uncharacterized protein n=1 Tax=Roseimaritima multifibrata TaxID=1930274 RepID=A0A517MA36_9BACT|nr:hypothetical protein FF011L_04850 [Roseimaritima multifibrata]
MNSVFSLHTGHARSKCYARWHDGFAFSLSCNTIKQPRRLSWTQSCLMRPFPNTLQLPASLSYPGIAMTVIAHVHALGRLGIAPFSHRWSYCVESRHPESSLVSHRSIRSVLRHRNPTLKRCAKYSRRSSLMGSSSCSRMTGRLLLKRFRSTSVVVLLSLRRVGASHDHVRRLRSAVLERQLQRF